MDSRNKYADPKPLPDRRAKLSIEQLEANPRYAAAAEVLRVLNAGMARLQAEIDVLNIEGHLARRPDDPRAKTIKALLSDRRQASGKVNAPPPAESTMPAAVVAALSLLNDGVPRRQRVNRRDAVAQLEGDMELIREAIAEQEPIVDAIRSELSRQAAERHAAKYHKLVVATFRAAQQLAAAADAEREFRAEFAAAGYAWLEQVMKGYQHRATLILGSEQHFDSEISRARRFLEEAKLL